MCFIRLFIVRIFRISTLLRKVKTSLETLQNYEDQFMELEITDPTVDDNVTSYSISMASYLAYS